MSELDRKSRAEELSGLLIRSVTLTQTSNAHVMALSAEMREVKNALEGSLRRQSAVMFLLCLSVGASIVLAWFMAQVSHNLTRTQRELTEFRIAQEVAVKRQEDAAATAVRALQAQELALKDLVKEAPKLELDGRGRPIVIQGKTTLPLK